MHASRKIYLFALQLRRRIDDVLDKEFNATQYVGFVECRYLIAVPLDMTQIQF